MKLRHIEKVDFRKSEANHYKEICKRMRLKLSGQEILLLISGRGDQLIFIWSEMYVDQEFDRKGGVGLTVSRAVLRSERLRLTSGGRWNPLMLGDYAKEVGIHLEGIKMFEEHLRRIEKQKKEA